MPSMVACPSGPGKSRSCPPGLAGLGWRGRATGRGVVRGGRHPQLADPNWLRRRYVHELASTRTIAVEVGCSEQTVLRALAAAGIPRGGRSRERQGVRELADQDWLRLRYEGEAATAEEIAAELGCSVTTVRRALK